MKRSVLNNIIEYFNRHEILCIFIFIFIIYNMNFRSVPSGDTIPASILPINMLNEHNIYLDKFSNIFFDHNLKLSYFVKEIHGHYLSRYPIVTPVMVTPIYVIPYILLKITSYPIDISNPGFCVIIEMMEKFSASIIASMSCIFIFLILRRLTSRRISYIGTIIYAFAVNTWTVSSQALWQHGIAELLLSAMIYLIIKNERNEDIKNYIILGVLSGLSIMNRFPNIILLLPIFFYVLKSKKSLICYCVSAIVAGLPFIVYNFYYFESFFGGYEGAARALFINFGTMVNFVNLLISPSRGLFIYSPILIFSILGFAHISDIKSNRLKICFYIFSISIVLDIIVYSTWEMWWGGGSYGPRFLTDVLPILVILLTLYLDKMSPKNKYQIIIFSILFSISVFVQIVGAFYYPNGDWNGHPINVDKSPERLWDWKDTQIRRTFLAGPVTPGLMYKLNRILEYKDIIDYDNNALECCGWYSLEYWNKIPTRWTSNNATIKTYYSDEKVINLSFNTISFNIPRSIQIYLNDKIIYRQNIYSDQMQKLEIRTKFEKGYNKIRFYSSDTCQRPVDISGLNNEDVRCLSFAFQYIELS